MAENHDHFCMALTYESLSPADQAVLKSQRAAVLKNARWQPGQMISVRFLGGDPKLQERVRNVALEWTKIASLKFDFVSQAPSDIRIAFAPGKGSWSYLGTTCRSIPEPRIQGSASLP